MRMSVNQAVTIANEWSEVEDMLNQLIGFDLTGTLHFKVGDQNVTVVIGDEDEPESLLDDEGFLREGQRVVFKLSGFAPTVETIVTVDKVSGAPYGLGKGDWASARMIQGIVVDKPEGMR